MVLESRPCALCGHFAGYENDCLGPLLGPVVNQRSGEEHYTHRLCALWSPEVYQNESGNLCNVLATIKRSRALRCSVCGQRGASIGCRVEACHQTFHLACAGKRGCLFNCDSFVLACPKHARFFKKEQKSQQTPLGQQIEDELDDSPENQPRGGRKRQNPELYEQLVAARKASKRARLEARLRPVEDESSDDEEHFRRKEETRLAKDRAKLKPLILGGNTAAVSSDTASTKTAWNAVGGLENVVQQLKEMVIFPLLYPEVFSQLGADPPRGILLHGEPGTGKTLVARALADACAQQSRKPVAFFARKGADCLGKFAGEAERTLRLLFDEAAKLAPSIIFLDELDGLLPARSTREGGSDQIYASVVTTMLSLMDGVKDRGAVVVIAATNRPDGIDPALRRPGRFDREVHFGLPNQDDRLKILRVHTDKWEGRPEESDLRSMAAATEGFAGADLMALCSASLLAAVRRSMPSLCDDLAGPTTSHSQFAKSLQTLQVTPEDWSAALRETGEPCSRRSGLAALSHRKASPLPAYLLPVLSSALQRALCDLHTVGVKLPDKAARVCSVAADLQSNGSRAGSMSAEGLQAEFQELLVSNGLVQPPCKGTSESMGLLHSVPDQPSEPVRRHPSEHSSTQARLLVCGDGEMGQQMIVDVIRLLLEGSPFHSISLAALVMAGQGDVIEGLISTMKTILSGASQSRTTILHLPMLETWALDTATLESDSSQSSAERCSESRRQNMLPGVGSSPFRELAETKRSRPVSPKAIAKIKQGDEKAGALDLVRASGIAEDGDESPAEIQAVVLSQIWCMFQQLVKQAASDKRLILLATSTWLPHSLPADLLGFFTSFSDPRQPSTAMSDRPCTTTGEPIVISSPDAATVEKACKVLLQQISEDTAEKCIQEIRARKAAVNEKGSTGKSTGIQEAPPPLGQDSAHLSGTTVQDPKQQREDQLVGSQLFAKIVSEITGLASRLLKDPKSKLVMGSISKKRQADSVRLLDVLRDAQNGVICMLGDFLEKMQETIRAAKASATQEKRYSARHAAACALEDEIQQWHRNLVMDLNLMDSKMASCLRTAEERVKACALQPESQDQEEMVRTGLNCSGGFDPEIVVEERDSPETGCSAKAANAPGVDQQQECEPLGNLVDPGGPIIGDLPRMQPQKTAEETSLTALDPTIHSELTEAVKEYLAEDFKAACKVLQPFSIIALQQLGKSASWTILSQCHCIVRDKMTSENSLQDNILSLVSNLKNPE